VARGSARCFSRVVFSSFAIAYTSRPAVMPRAVPDGCYGVGSVLAPGLSNLV